VLVAAVERGWARARRTILASDTVNLLAAVVLYLLAVGGVKGFAFTLGLTTLLDVLVVFMFTHPVLELLSKTKFFGEGHVLSGLDPRRLGIPSVRYAGRGRVVTVPPGTDTTDASEQPSKVDAGSRVPVAVGAPNEAGLTIAQRRAAAKKASAETADAPVDGTPTESEPEPGRTEGNEH
jgi:preprotein translocase subunit SecD